MDYDVRYPLISSRRVWQYNEPTTPLDNIDTNTGRIDYTELFPSLKVEKIFEAIQSTYGVTFEGSWLQSEQFQKLFLMCKNTNQFTFLTPSERVDITNDINTSSFVADSVSNFISYPFDYNLFSSGGTILYHVLTFRVLSVTTFDDYYIDVYKNGVLVNTISGSGVNDYYSARDPEYFTAFRVIKCGVVSLHQDQITSGSATVQKKIPLKFNHHLKYNTDGSTTTTKNQMYLFVTCSGGDLGTATGATIQYNMRWYYTDN